ncbi:hypothetical protein BKA70DRAFT_1231739 [Coprinopsis sp. MPI-PUGE-AT-0042]|nr:hypothetical protein BKA70DRAFT_1231739 [Coprinopsis sp. MPI-PUGE-AT-0042]
MDLPFLLSMFIHKAEEEAMGIEPEATDGHRLEYDIPDSDGLDADVQMRDLEEEPGDVDVLDSRQRSGTVTQSSIQYPVDAIDSWTTVHTDLTGRVDFSPRYLGSPLGPTQAERADLSNPTIRRPWRISLWSAYISPHSLFMPGPASFSSIHLATYPYAEIDLDRKESFVLSGSFPMSEYESHREQDWLGWA